MSKPLRSGLQPLVQLDNDDDDDQHGPGHPLYTGSSDLQLADDFVDLGEDLLLNNTQSRTVLGANYPSKPRKYLHLNDSDDDDDDNDDYQHISQSHLDQTIRSDREELDSAAAAEKHRNNFRQRQSAMGTTEGTGSGGAGQPNGNFRMLYLNDPVKNAQFKYLHNRISTAKYNLITFLPKFLYEQFSKYANLFFLFTAIIQVSKNVK
jgi:hypothetical protein